MFERSLKRHQRQSLGRVGRERCEPEIQILNNFRNDYYVSLSQIFISISFFKPRPKIRGKFFFSNRGSFRIFGVIENTLNFYGN